MEDKNTYLATNRFSGRRFGKFLRLYLSENSRQFALSVLTMFGCLVIVYILLSLQSAYIDYQTPGKDWIWKDEAGFSIVLCLVFSALSGNMMFSDFSSKSSRLKAITLPALQSEKFLVRFLVHVPMFLIAFFACAWLADIVRLGFVRIFLTKIAGYTGIIPANELFTFSVLSPYDSGRTTLAIIFIYFMILLAGALYSLGGVIFAKQSFIKVSVAYFIIGIVCSTASIFSSVIFNVIDIELPSIVENTYFLSSMFAVILIAVYTLVYARMREAEVINRW